jgi:hypothetical protein
MRWADNLHADRDAGVRESRGHADTRQQRLRGDDGIGGEGERRPLALLVHILMCRRQDAQCGVADPVEVVLRHKADEPALELGAQRELGQVLGVVLGPAPRRKRPSGVARSQGPCGGRERHVSVRTCRARRWRAA